MESYYASRVRRIIAVAILVLLVALASWLPRREHARPLVVALGMWPGSEALVLARESAMLRHDRFKWVELTWPSAAYRMLSNGAADVAVLPLADAESLSRAGKEVRVVYLLDESHGADGLVARQGIATIHGLKGQRVGVDARGSGRRLLLEALEHAGMSMADVEPVTLLQPEMTEALNRGDVSAVAISEPWMSPLRQSGAQILADSTPPSRPVIRAVVVSESALVGWREQVLELLRVLEPAGKILRDGDASASGLKWVLARQGLSQAQFSQMLQRVIPLSVDQNKEMLRKGAIPGWDAAEVAKWVDASLIEEVEP